MQLEKKEINQSKGHEALEGVVLQISRLFDGKTAFIQKEGKAGPGEIECVRRGNRAMEDIKYLQRIMRDKSADSKNSGGNR